MPRRSTKLRSGDRTDRHTEPGVAACSALAPTGRYDGEDELRRGARVERDAAPVRVGGAPCTLAVDITLLAMHAVGRLLHLLHTSAVSATCSVAAVDVGV